MARARAIEKAVPALVLALIILPLAVLVTGFAWNALPRAFRGRFPGRHRSVPVHRRAGGGHLALRHSLARL